jgi:hypothetical protein
MPKSANVSARIAAGSRDFGMLEFHQLPGNKARRLQMMTETLFNANRRQVPGIRNPHRLILAVAMGVSLMGNAGGNSTQIDRAHAEHSAPPGAQMQPGQISEAERRALLRIKRALREKDERSQSERCVDEEVARIDRPPSDLEWRVIDLKCREIGGPSVVPNY